MVFRISSLTMVFCVMQMSLAQSQNLEYLKSSPHPGNPDVSEILNWVEKSLIFGSCVPDINSVVRRTCDPNGEDYSPTFTLKIDAIPVFRRTEIPCDILLPYFVVNERDNTFDFKIDNMGCSSGAYPLEPGKVTVFLDNFDPDNIKISDGNLTIMSWGSNSTKHILGYIVWSNYNDCTGVGFETFTSLTFPLPKLLMKDILLQNKLIAALKYLGKISSAKNKECKFLGAEKIRK